MKMPALLIDAEEELKRVTANIKVARKRRRMSLAELAERAGVASSTIFRLESGDPTVAFGTVLQVLGVLGLVNGISEIVAPENDVRPVMEEVRNLRLRKRGSAKRTFSEAEIQF